MQDHKKQSMEIKLTIDLNAVKWGVFIIALCLIGLAVVRLTFDIDSTAIAAPSVQTDLVTQAVGTSFTYQGLLYESGKPASGSYDINFTLSGDELGTSTIGSPILKSNLTVTDGHFATTLDFGNVFDGSERWLKLEVRQSGTATFTTLSPLEKITGTPYSFHTESIDWSNISNIPAGFADNTDNVDDADASTTNEIQDLSRSDNTLSLTGDATTVDLAPYLDNTDTLADLNCTTDQIAQYNGSNWACATAPNEIQDLSRSGNTLSLTGDATTVDLAPYLDNTDTLADLNCTTDQIAQYNGSNWACAATPSATNSTIMETHGVFLTANIDTFGASSSGDATEGRNRYKAPKAGTIRNLCIIGNFPPAVGSSAKVTIRVNGADTAVSVGPYTSTDANGLCDTTNSVAVSQGDLISVRFQETLGVNTGSNVHATYEYELD